MIPCLQASTKVLSISSFKGWRQPSSAVHHTPELIANQSSKVQLVSKPISNFSCSSCLRLLGVKVGNESAFRPRIRFQSLAHCPLCPPGLQEISYICLLKNFWSACIIRVVIELIHFVLVDQEIIFLDGLNNSKGIFFLMKTRYILLLNCHLRKKISKHFHNFVVFFLLNYRYVKILNLKGKGSKKNKR